MNFLPAKVTAVDGAGATVQLAGGSTLTVPVPARPPQGRATR